MRRLVLSVATALALATAATPALAAGEAEHPRQQEWSFSGIFGTYDRAAVQRGFQVYKEVCSACHALMQKSYRHLSQIGFSEDEIRAIAAQYQVQDGPNDEGEMFERPARAADRFKRPFPNEQAARAANNGAYPVDLSLIVKARHDGANYVYSLLTGYKDAPAGKEVGEGMYYNPYFPGAQIGMASPLNPDAVTYADGTKATVEQMAKDVTYFLAWAAEPELEARKRLGVQSVLFLIVLSCMLYAVKRKVWADVHH
ncbi:MAG: cytochrome c1 [Alphaproteobacteria bacterium]|nr:MAG: cytochrome c1 [Alphaproteobacteria bacterium]